MTASTSTAPPVSAATYSRIGFRVVGIPAEAARPAVDPLAHAPYEGRKGGVLVRRRLETVIVAQIGDRSLQGVHGDGTMRGAEVLTEGCGGLYHAEGGGVRGKR